MVTAEQLWDNLEYMLKAIVPVAEKANVKLAIHPDDPPVPSIQHVGRILTSADAIEKAINLVPSKNLGITLCQGWYTAMGEDVLNIIERFKEKTFFVHFRDISARDPYAFHETFQDNGVNDMAECIRRYVSNGFNGYIRVDHVPTMAGEENENPGYETLGRLYEIGYLEGLIEMAYNFRKIKKSYFFIRKKQKRFFEKCKRRGYLPYATRKFHRNHWLWFV